jgi:hypothetical protein
MSGVVFPIFVLSLAAHLLLFLEVHPNARVSSPFILGHDPELALASDSHIYNMLFLKPVIKIYLSWVRNGFVS